MTGVSVQICPLKRDHQQVTSNHVHLLVLDRGREEIATSLQLIAGRTGQSFNQRKRRRGAFWEDRYHATAVDTQEYLARCLVYIDLNMVRAGVVRHPRDWEEAGYHELQQARVKYCIVDRAAVAGLLAVPADRQIVWRACMRSGSRLRSRAAITGASGYGAKPSRSDGAPSWRRCKGIAARRRATGVSRRKTGRRCCETPTEHTAPFRGRNGLPNA